MNWIYIIKIWKDYFVKRARKQKKTKNYFLLKALSLLYKRQWYNSLFRPRQISRKLWKKGPSLIVRITTEDNLGIRSFMIVKICKYVLYQPAYGFLGYLSPDSSPPYRWPTTCGTLQRADRQRTRPARKTRLSVQSSQPFGCNVIWNHFHIFESSIEAH